MNKRRNNSTQEIGREFVDHYSMLKSPQLNSQANQDFMKSYMRFCNSSDDHRGTQHESENRDNHPNHGSVPGSSGNKKPRNDLKVEKIRILEKINREMKVEMSNSFRKGEDEKQRLMTELTAAKDHAKDIKKASDQEKEKITKFMNENKAFKAILRHELEMSKQSRNAIKKELSDEKVLTKDLTQQTEKLRKDLEEEKFSNGVKIMDLIDQKDEIINNLKTQLSEEKNKIISLNKVNKDLKTNSDNCISKLKSNYNSQIVSLKKSKNYFQTWNEKNKRKNLAVIYRQKRQELMYNKNPRKIVDTTEKNVNEVVAEYRQDFMELFAKMNQTINKRNSSSVAVILKENIKENKEILEEKKILERIDDKLMCPQPNCGKSFATNGDFCKHMAMKHFLYLNDDNSTPKKSPKKSRKDSNNKIRDIIEIDV